MQKKLIALAIAGLSGAAFAQSNVTVYGVADGTFDFINVSSGRDSASNVNFNRVSTNSSLIGFKGVEDLGNGLKAVFQFESGVSFDAGSAGTFSTSRDSFVALAGGFGTVALGNLTGPTRAFGAAVDVNDGATGIGANSALIGKLGNLLVGGLNTASTSATLGQIGTLFGNCGRSSTCASTYDTRFTNAIAYISPDMGGFTAIVGYVPNEGKSAGANPSAWDLGLKYANGPILAGLSHADVKLKNTGSAAVTQGALVTLAGGLDNAHTTNTRLVGSYDFGVASVRALWEKTKLDVAAINDINQTVWGIGGTFSVTPAGKIIAQYYKANELKAGSNIGGSDAKLWEIGYEHSLSKRTLVKAVYSRLDNGNAAGYDYGVNATGLANGFAGTPNATNNGATLSGIQIGLRHKF